MSDMSFAFPTSVSEQDYQALTQEMFAEIARLNQSMDDNRKEIELLKSESNLLKVETRAILATLGAAV